MPTRSESPPASTSFAEYLAGFGFAGAMAGVALTALELVDRLFVLRHFLRGVGENVDFALLTAMTAPGIFLVSIVAGALLWLVDFAIRKIPVFRQTSNGARVSAAFAAKALIVAIALVIVVVIGLPYIRQAMMRVAYHLQLQRGADLETFAFFVPFVLALPLLASALAVRFLLARQVSRAIRIALGVALVLFCVGGYWVDSRWLVGLADDTLHLGAGLCAAGASIGCGLLVWIWLLDLPMATRRRIGAGCAAALILLSVGAVIGAARLGRDHVASALLFTRGVYAQRVATALEGLADWDGDDFSHAFDGGDPNDADAQINPLAREIPGDHIDQNGLGGDWTPEVERVDPSSPLFFAGGYMSPAPGPGPRNVLFVSIDALRADHLSCYGYRRPTSPHLDAFAARSAFFERTISQATSTGHSFASMMTGAYGDDVFDPEQPRLGALLGAHGYRTAFLNSAPFHRFINRDDYWLYYRDIMSDGFTPVDNEDHSFRAADRLTDDAIAYLKSVPADQPHFTWVHYRDPHAGYVRHKEFDYGSRPVDRYDSEIAFTDFHLGRLLEYLDASGALQNTLVIITADHGESFGEHGDYTHHRRPYATLSHIPLIVWWPGVSPTTVSTPTAGVDFAPTIVNWTGLTEADRQRALARFDGLDLRWQAAQPSSVLSDRAVVGETPRNCNEASFFAWAIVQRDHYLIYDIVGPRVELFDIETDPLQRRNLADEDPESRQRLLSLLGHWLDRLSVRPGFSGWAQMQPSFLSPAPEFPPPPQHEDRRRGRQRDDDGE